MVVAGAMAQSFMLPVFAFGTVYLQRRHLPPELMPARAVQVGLWLAAIVIAAVMSVSLALTLLRG